MRPIHTVVSNVVHAKSYPHNAKKEKKKASNLQFAMSAVTDTQKKKKKTPDKSNLGKAVLFAIVKIIHTSNMAGAFQRVMKRWC